MCPTDGDWSAAAGTTPTLPCGRGYNGDQTRFCTEDGVWEDPDRSNCGRTGAGL